MTEAAHQPEGGAPPPLPVNPNLRWYALQVYSGFEQKVKQLLEDKIRTSNMADKFGEVLLPMEQVVELVRGKKRTTKRKFFHGYLLVQAQLDDDVWYLIRSIPKVTGFVGDDRSPTPIKDEEIANIKGRMEAGEDSPKMKVSFTEGQAVHVIEGAFANFNGTVDSVNEEKGKLTVLVSIFGRSTPVELDFSQVERL